MASLINISEAASLALHAAAVLAACDEGSMTTAAIAEELGVSEAHLAKVLQRLSKVGLVKGTRGPGGGFRLVRRPERTTLLDIYEAMEGPITLDQCLFGHPVCGRRGCPLGDALKEASDSNATGPENTKLDKISIG